MNEVLKYLMPVKTKWDAFAPRQKRNIVIILVCLVFCITVIAWMMTRPNYVTIMSGLDNTSLGQVQTELQTLKIPNQINGSSILVPKVDANEARVQLSEAGLPQSGFVDYSSIKSTYAMTQSQFNLQVLNVLQQSLEQTIDTMNGITASQVHIVMPQQSNMFISNQTSPATASVYLELGAGVQLSPLQVQGIQELVAHSVQGLSASNVSVVDQNGVSLSPNQQSGTSGLMSTAELQQRQQIEQQIQQQLQQGLDQILGTGNSVVNVNANVTFNQTESQSHTVTPVAGSQTGLPTSQQTSSSSSTNGGGAGGIVGASTSNPGSATSYPGGGTTNSTSTSSQSTTNYDNNYVNTKTVSDPIQIKGYSVGVVLNSADKSISPAVVNQIKSYIQSTVGNQPGLSNNVTVSSVPFKANTIAFPPTPKPWLKWAIEGAAALVIAGIVLAMLRRRKKPGEPPMQTTPMLELQDDTLRVDDTTGYVKRKVSKMAEENPDQFSNLVRNWLNEN